MHLYRNRVNGIPLPYKINFNLTYRCNSFCRHCRIWKLYTVNQEEMIRKELTLEDYKKFLSSLGRNLFIASFEGGEPFLREDLADIVLTSVRECKNLLMLWIDSNGLLPEIIEKQVRDILKENRTVPLYVALSLDGQKSIHDSIRGVSGAYEKVMESRDRLLKIGIPNLKVYFQTTISRMNWRNILELYSQYKRNMVFTLCHNAALFHNEDDQDSVFHIEEKEEFISVLKQLVGIYQIRDYPDILNKMFIKQAISYVRSRKPPVPCYASFATLSIDPYGNVRPCSFIRESFGNILHVNHELNMLLKQAGSELRDKIRKGDCPLCWMNCDALPSLLHSFMPF
ncbi:MAG: radical SAM protein [Candidatus Aureabacteria bacterium]|nr:radical SAM protein [Candidatus Auribacterota bacterium]